MIEKMSISSGEVKEVVATGSRSAPLKKVPELNISTPNFNIRSIQRILQMRQPALTSVVKAKRVGSEIRQRVLSARQHRQKTVQNQLNVALKMNAELTNENRLLRTLHKRQDTALSKYENSSSELPQLISSYADELRAWQTKYRTLNLQCRELNRRLQLKDKTLNELNDRIKHLNGLAAEKHLEEREVLKAKLQTMERQLEERDNEIRQLNRRNNLEAKNSKTQLANERKKYKELCQKQTIEKTGEKISSNDSDYSSAKDVKEYISKVKSANNATLSASSVISHELPLNGTHANIEDNDDDIDLVIRHIIDESNDKPDDMADDQIVQQMADIQLFTDNGMQKIQDIKRKIQKDIEKNEVLLDLHCDEISRDIGTNQLPRKSVGSFGDNAVTNRSIGVNSDYPKIKSPSSNGYDEKATKAWNKMPMSPSNPPTSESIAMNTDQLKARRPSSLPRFNINSSGRLTQRIPIDPQKKSKLLAQLKSIEAANANL